MPRHPNGDVPSGEAPKFEPKVAGPAAVKPDTIWIKGEGGSVYEMDLPLSEGLAQRLLKGYLQQVNPDGTPYTKKTQAQKLIDTGEAFVPLADSNQVAYGASNIVASQYRPNSVDTLSAEEADYKTAEAKRVLAQDRAIRADQREVNKRAANAPVKDTTDSDVDNAGWVPADQKENTDGEEATSVRQGQARREGRTAGEEGQEGEEAVSSEELTPARSASKAEWIGHAVRVGNMTPDDAEAMTKQDLIERFGDGV